MEDFVNINPRLQHAIAYWKLKNPYESLIVSWSKQKNMAYAIPGDSPKKTEENTGGIQEEEIPTLLFLSFMNIFLGGRLTAGVDGETFSPFLYFSCCSKGKLLTNSFIKSLGFAVTELDSL